MIELCADVLCVLVVMLSSAQDMDFSVHFPSKRQLSGFTDYCSVSSRGWRCHFDGTLEENFDDQARPGMCA